MSRSMTVLVLLLSLLLGAIRPATAQPPQPSSDKAEWIAFLTRATQLDSPTYQKLSSLMRLDPELTYTILKECWKDIPLEALRLQLIQLLGIDTYTRDIASDPKDPDPLALYQNEKVRSHLLDMIDLGANDSSIRVQQRSFAMAAEIALKPIPDAAAYQAWRKEVGDTPIAEIMRANCRALFTKFVQADNTQKMELLFHINALSFSRGHFAALVNGKMVNGIIATGLTGVRRNTAIACGLPEALLQCLKEGTPPAITLTALPLLTRFELSDALYAQHDSDMRRILTPLISDDDPQNQIYALNVLARIKSPWATDLLLKRIVDTYPDPSYQNALYVLGVRKDPRIIPTLIALLDAGVEANQRQQINRALFQFDPTAHDIGADADRWLEWWEENKATLPAEVRALPFPKFKGSEEANLVSIPHRNRRILIDDNSQRAYWLISPGISLVNASGGTTDTSPLPQKDRPGLMVVLCDGDASDLKQRTFWLDVAAKAFGSKYLIALVVPPKWNATQKAVWITANNRSQVKEATFTTETLVADVVKEIVKRYPINPEHVFLHGEGDAGLAAYACSLQPQTPFHGFYLLSSAFHTSELPPLTNAKGRRYFLQHSQSDKTVPYFLASAVGQLLTKAGATVKLETYQGEHGYHFAGDFREPMEQALQWLEEAKQAGSK